jgi:DNA-binding MarR family transcriptional regulator
VIEPFASQFLTPTKDFRRLSVLTSIHSSPCASQHKIAQETHLSSSMVNIYIKTLKKEGLIHVSGSTNRNQRYHLTDQGHTELVSSFLAYSAEIVRFYGAVKRETIKILDGFYDEGIRSVALFGAAETAEVVLSAVRETAIDVIGVVDSDVAKQGRTFHGLVIQAPQQLEAINPDAVIITSFGKQEEIYRTVSALVQEARTIQIKKLINL